MFFVSVQKISSLFFGALVLLSKLFYLLECDLRVELSPVVDPVGVGIEARSIVLDFARLNVKLSFLFVTNQRVMLSIV